MDEAVGILLFTLAMGRNNGGRDLWREKGSALPLPSLPPRTSRVGGGRNKINRKIPFFFFFPVASSSFHGCRKGFFWKAQRRRRKEKRERNAAATTEHFHEACLEKKRFWLAIVADGRKLSLLFLSRYELLNRVSTSSHKNGGKITWHREASYVSVGRCSARSLPNAF